MPLWFEAYMFGLGLGVGDVSGDSGPSSFICVERRPHHPSWLKRNTHSFFLIQRKLWNKRNRNAHTTVPLCSASVGLVAKWPAPALGRTQGWRLRDTVVFLFSFAL